MDGHAWYHGYRTKGQKPGRVESQAKPDEIAISRIPRLKDSFVEQNSGKAE